MLDKQNINKCLTCHLEIPLNKPRNKYCNHSCRAIDTNKLRGPRTQETKNKIGLWAKANPRGFIADISKKGPAHNRFIPREIRKCLECSNDFEIRPTHNKKYCGNDCRNKNAGGYRPGSGRGKSGRYKGFFCDSTYELAFVIYYLDHKLFIERNKERFPYINAAGKQTFYLPDFITDDGLIEIKGYKSELNDLKLSAVNKPIKILYRKNLKTIFSYIEQQYNIKIEKLYHLYEI